MVLLFMIISAIGGAVTGYLLAMNPDSSNRKIYRLIQKEFGLKSNEYALEYDPETNEYILIYDSTTYILKLSNKRPLAIVSLQEIE